MDHEFDSLQFVVFLQIAWPSAPIPTLWQQIVGADLEKVQTLPDGTQQATGRYEGLSVVLFSQPGRIDLLVLPHPMATSPATLAKGTEIGLRLSRRMADAEKVFRVAAVFRSSAEQPSAEAAAARVSDFAPAKAPAEATDLWYQTTVPVMSQVAEGYSISRLLRFNVGRKQQTRIGASGKVLDESDPFVVVKYADVFVDTIKAIPAGSASPLFEEVAGIAQDIISRGYAALHAGPQFQTATRSLG